MTREVLPAAYLDLELLAAANPCFNTKYRWYKSTLFRILQLGIQLVQSISLPTVQMFLHSRKPYAVALLASPSIVHGSRTDCLVEDEALHFW